MRPEVIGLVGLGVFALIVGWGYVYFLHLHFKDKHQ